MTKLPEKFPVIITMTNLLKTEGTDNRYWNTGMSAVGDPHCNEDPKNTGKAIIEREDNLLPVLVKNQTAINIFGLRNQYLILDEGESVSVTVDTAEAATYYLSQASDALKVEVKETGSIANASDAESL